MQIAQLTPTDRILETARLTKRVLRRPGVQRSTEDVIREYSEGWKSFRRELDKSRTLDEWLCIPGREDNRDWIQRNGKLAFEGADIGRLVHLFFAGAGAG